MMSSNQGAEVAANGGFVLPVIKSYVFNVTSIISHVTIHVHDYPQICRNYQHNYLTTFLKAALIFVTHSNWGSWHHVEVHDEKFLR